MRRKENKAQKNWHDLSDCCKQFSCGFFIFRKRGIMNWILENCFCFREKVNGNFLFSKKKQAIFCWSAGI